MITWDGMDLIGLAVLGILVAIWIAIQIFSAIGRTTTKRRKKRWERMAKKDYDE